MKLSAWQITPLRAGAVALAALTIGTGTAAATTARARPAAIPKCTAGDLGVWAAASQGNGAAGSIYYPLEFTNLSKSTCYLYGHPGVSATTAGGHQLGQAARWIPGTPGIVNLAPGATAHAVLAYVDVQVSPGCHPVAAGYLKIYPPDQTYSTNAFWDLSSCTTGPVYMDVGVIQPGPGTRNNT